MLEIEFQLRVIKLKKILLVVFILIFASGSSYAKNYDCKLNQKLKNEPEYYFINTDPKKMQVTYVYKFPGFIEKTKINKITKIETDIIFFEDRQRYYDQNKKGYVYTGKKTLKKLRPSIKDHIEILSYSDFKVGNNVEWITHYCEKISVTNQKISSKIELIKKLYENGALTKEEFEIAKKKLLKY